jgi:hypothetical protein
LQITRSSNLWCSLCNRSGGSTKRSTRRCSTDRGISSNTVFTGEWRQPLCEREYDGLGVAHKRRSERVGVGLSEPLDEGDTVAISVGDCFCVSHWRLLRGALRRDALPAGEAERLLRLLQDDARRAELIRTLQGLAAAGEPDSHNVEVASVSTPRSGPA